MTGLLALGFILATGILGIAAIAFVTLAVGTMACQLMIKLAPSLKNATKSLALVCATGALAIASVDIVTDKAVQPDGFFSFVSSTNHVDPNVAQADSSLLTAKNQKATPVDQGDSTSFPVTAEADVSASQSNRSLETKQLKQFNIPEWAKQKKARSGDTTYVVITSELHDSKQSAIQQIHSHAAELIRRDFAQHNAAEVRWELPTQVVEDSIRRTYFATESHDLLENGIYTNMHRAYAQVTVSPSIRNAIYPGWRKLVASQRLVKLGKGFGLATLVLMSLALYLRYDHRTEGKRRGRIGVLTLAILASGSLALAELGESLKAKLEAAGIVEAEYLRDRIPALEDTVITSDSPLIEVPNEDDKIAILIDNIGQLSHPEELVKQVADSITSFSTATEVTVHAITDLQQESVTVVAGRNENENVIRNLVQKHSGKATDLTKALSQVIGTQPDSVYVLTDRTAGLSDAQRSSVASMPTNIPVSFIKLTGDNLLRFDSTLKDMVGRTGGYVRFFMTGE